MTEVILTVDYHSDDKVELERLTNSLFKDLGNLGAAKVDRSRTAAPKGAKSDTIAQLSELVLTGLVSASGLSAIARVLIAHIGAKKAKSVSWEENGRKVVFTGVSAEDQHALAELMSRPQGEAKEK